jgi:hypothetical protein
MRISLDALRAIYSQESGDYPILLITVADKKMTSDIRISTDPTTRLPAYTNDENVVYGTVSSSLDYFYCPVEISLPGEEEDAAPQTEITVSNVGRELVETIRSLTSSPTITIDLVLASNPDQIEYHISGFTFQDITINTLTITGTLTIEMLTNEPFPFRTFTTSTAPGLFKL